MMTFLVISAASVIGGSGLALYLLFARPVFFRRILQLLWALSYAVQDFGASFKKHSSDRLSPVTSKAAIAAPQPPATPSIADDVTEGLIKLGMRTRDAKRFVGQAVAALPGCNEFEPLFRSAMAQSKGTAA